MEHSRRLDATRRHPAALNPDAGRPDELGAPIEAGLDGGLASLDLWEAHWIDLGGEG